MGLKNIALNHRLSAYIYRFYKPTYYKIGNLLNNSRKLKASGHKLKAVESTN